MIVVYNVPYNKYPQAAQLILILLLVIDLVVQILTCYICGTVGSSEQIKNCDCVYVDDGGYKLKYRAKQDVPE
jgi:hypothetical protein